MSEEPSRPSHPSYPLLPADHDIGYGKPPVAHWLKPGQSGNPKGRPKGISSLANVLGKVLFGKVAINQDGQTKNIQAIDGMLRAVRSRAFKGDIRATAFLLDLAEKHKINQLSELRRELHIRFVEADPALVAEFEKEENDRS